MKEWKWSLLSILLVIAPVSAARWEADITSRTDAHTKEVVALRHWFHANQNSGDAAEGGKPHQTDVEKTRVAPLDV